MSKCILDDGKKTFDAFADIVTKASYSGNIELDGHSINCRFYGSEAWRTARDGPAFAYIRIEVEGKFTFNGTYRRRFVNYNVTDEWNGDEFAFEMLHTETGTKREDIDYILTMMLLQRDSIRENHFYV